MHVGRVHGALSRGTQAKLSRLKTVDGGTRFDSKTGSPSLCGHPISGLDAANVGAFRFAVSLSHAATIRGSRLVSDFVAIRPALHHRVIAEAYRRNVLASGK